MARFLDAAIGVFRAKGYHATSVSDLKEASTVAAGSIYKAFKDKRAVFLATFDRYVSRRESQRQAAIGKGTTGREKLCEFLTAYAKSTWPGG
jgi:TetR/AcrR family transcriptional repressor of nem operon